jgi:hypothetical protein
MRVGCVGVVAALLALPGVARAAPDADLVAALDAARADVVAFELPAAPGAPHVRAATIACAPPATVLGVLADPDHYAALLPSLVRAETTGRRGAARTVAWELEVPLFNLSGTMEIRPSAGGVELALLEGDLAPGRVAFQAAARADGCTTVTIDARLDVRRSSWFLRHVMARSEYGQPAALAAAAWTSLRATALRAEHPHDAVAFRPTAPPLWPAAGVPDGRVLLQPPLIALGAKGAAAVVRSAASGRLVGVAVGVPAAGAPGALAARLHDSRSWRYFPGWKVVRPMPPAGGGAGTVVVEDSIPFVELDATWQPAPAAPGAWVAIAGAARGAWFGWTVGPRDGGAQAVLTLAPRLELTGSIPRRFITAEPLLEHGLALALAFVDAVSATRGGGR